MLCGSCPGIVPARMSGHESRLASEEVRARVEWYLGCVRPEVELHAPSPLFLLSPSRLRLLQYTPRARSGPVVVDAVDEVAGPSSRAQPCPERLQRRSARSVCALYLDRYVVRTHSFRTSWRTLTTCAGSPVIGEWPGIVRICRKVSAVCMAD